VTAPAYETVVRKLVEEGTTRVVVDFEQLNYISSAGLGELIVTLKLLKEKDGRLAVANVHGNVLAVFEMCGIQKVIQIHKSVADALAAVK
jgi:anti-anti-sigma factor